MTLFFVFTKMLTFFYDSLDSLKKVKKPTTKEVINLTIVIFVVVIISALLFAAFDGLFAASYQWFYWAMTWAL